MIRQRMLRICYIQLLVLILIGGSHGELIGLWKFDAGHGTTAVDSSGRGFDITLHSTVWDDGLFGGAVNFQDRGYGNAESFEADNNAVTLCAWVWHSSFRTGRVERYVTLTPEVAVIRKEADGRLHFYIKTDGSLKHLWIDQVLSEGHWHYVSGTWDGMTQRLYIDGQEVASQMAGGVLGHTSNIMISSGAESLNGKLDEIHVYNRALTGDEIRSLMQGEGWPLASDPTPADDAIIVDTHVTLSWEPGFRAQQHTVYFGDNYDDITNAAGGISQTTPNFETGPLEVGKTYYWRVDEFDGLETHKGEIWSFTVSGAGDEWPYDGGILVGAHYYPWYGPNAHRVSSSLRGHLMPPQTAELGEYESSSQEVISRHIDYSHRANIHFWLCSWWGPGTKTDQVIRNSILRHPRAGELRYAILYESTGRLGSFSNPDYSNLLSDFQYFADYFFDNPSYLKIGERPVVFIYLTRAYFRDYPGYNALSDLRDAFLDVYIIADDIFGRNYSSTYARRWDAVTAYDVYGQTLQSRGSTRAALNELERILSRAKTAANNAGVGLIPFATPGFNDRGMRDGHKGAPRYFEDEDTSVEGDLFRAMLRNVVVPKTDPLAEHMLLVTSFNEWHEDTQIEPTTSSGRTDITNVDDSPSGSAYTQGDYYSDYGYLYLDILSEQTSVVLLDPLSEAMDTTLEFTIGGDAEWFSQTLEFMEDADAARSGEVSNDEESWLQTNLSETGMISFYWKVSSEDGFDFLEFYIEGSLQNKISGSVDWHEVTYEITEPNSHALKWRYAKDSSVDSGSDCGWLDRVVWTPGP